MRKSNLFTVFIFFIALFGVISIFADMLDVQIVSDFAYASHGETPHVDPAPDFDFLNKPNLPTTNIVLLLILSFAAGVLSFLSPCTLPILPAYFAVTFQVDRKRIFMMSITFFIGLASLFVIMGASASFLGSVLRGYLDSLTKIGGIFIIVFGVMTFFGKGFTGVSFLNKPSSTFIGSFMFGATFALGWTPCIGPILSGVLVLAASDKTVYQGMLLLFFYALGLGLPLIIISSIFSKLGKNSLFWRILRGYGWTVKIGSMDIYLHTTAIISGLLLIFLGVLLASGYLTMLNSLIPIELQAKFNDLEHFVMELFKK